jgi:hypothetical protein
MSLSANTLIHFTKSKDDLKGILEDNFKIYFCRESIILEKNVIVYIAPMVSFCDIPLSNIKVHISRYGNYGIGMTKEWGIRNGLNPVLYMVPGSNLSKSYRKAYNHFMNAGKISANSYTDEQKSFADVSRHIKNYEGELTRNGTTTNYRFSDEREWRYAPPDSILPYLFVGEIYYSNPVNKAALNAKIESLRLTFEPNDIKYIIINDDSEIREFIDHLRDVKGRKYSLQEIERLTTRILTTEQIKEDI